MNNNNQEITQEKNLARVMYKNLEQEVAYWLRSVPFTDFSQRIRTRVIGQKGLETVLANVYQYLICIAERRPVRHNMLIAAPSGSGKTETYRALKDYFAVNLPVLPVYMFDLTQLSPSGFRGANLDDMLSPFFNMQLAHPFGLFFMDEFDKRLKPSYSASGHNVNKELQNNLLSMLEGAPVYDRQHKTIYTDRIMFFGMGSFDEFRKEREDAPRAVGFMEEDQQKSDHYSYILREDMYKAGATNELLGRFPFIVNYDRLSEDAVRKIIEKMLSDAASMLGCKIRISEEFSDRLLKAANSKYGCRTLDNLIRQSALNAYQKYLNDRNFSLEATPSLFLKSETEGEVENICKDVERGLLVPVRPETEEEQ